MFGCTLFALCAVAFAQGTAPSFQLLTTIKVPGLSGSDINWVDPGTQRLYTTDHTATKGTGRIDVIDTDSMKLLYTIPQTKNEIAFSGTVPNPKCGFSGNSGPNGVVAIPGRQLYVGDGDSTVKVVDLRVGAIVATIPTGGTCRADELAYDPLDHIVMVANDQDSPPFVTFISTDTQTVLGKYTYPPAQIGGGLEQPVWNPKTKKFYLAVPAYANGANSGSIDQINPLTMTVEKSIPTQCSPAGLVLTGNQHLMTSCGQLLDAVNLSSLGNQNNAQGDEIWFNPGDNYVYFGYFNGFLGLGHGVAVVDATTLQLLTYIPIPSGSPVHSLAVDSNNNRVFVPVTGQGIQVWAAQ